MSWYHSVNLTKRTLFYFVVRNIRIPYDNNFPSVIKSCCGGAAAVLLPVQTYLNASRASFVSFRLSSVIGQKRSINKPKRMRMAGTAPMRSFSVRITSSDCLHFPGLYPVNLNKWEQEVCVHPKLRGCFSPEGFLLSSHTLQYFSPIFPTPLFFLSPHYISNCVLQT